MTHDKPAGITSKGVEIKSLAQVKAWFKDRILNNIKNKVRGVRDQDIVARALVFSKSNKDCLVIIGDTRKDKITMAYNNEFMITDIKSKFMHLNQQLLKKNLTKDFKGLTEQQIAETRVELNNIFRSLLFNFIQIINFKKDEKVAKTENIIK